MRKEYGVWGVGRERRERGEGMGYGDWGGKGEEGMGYGYGVWEGEG